MKTEETTGWVFPLSGGSPVRPLLRAPRLRADVGVTPGFVMGNRAFMRAWAARRVGVARASRPCLNDHGQDARAT